MPDTNADIAAIRRLDAEWSEAASGGIANLDRVVEFYAADGSTVWPGAPASKGSKNILKAWKRSFQELEGLKLKFGPTDIRISADGTMASDFGRVAMSYLVAKRVNRQTTKQRIHSRAKYVVVWTKADGEWKVLYDCWNLNSGN
jgi:ketosteroid isomerase-like protein